MKKLSPLLLLHSTTPRIVTTHCPSRDINASSTPLTFNTILNMRPSDETPPQDVRDHTLYPDEGIAMLTITLASKSLAILTSESTGILQYP